MDKTLLDIVRLAFLRFNTAKCLDIALVCNFQIKFQRAETVLKSIS